MTRRRPDGIPAQAASEQVKQAPRQTLEEWAADLCRVKACRDGFVSMEIGGYSRLFACPQCDRAYTARPGYTSIPSIARWKGQLVTYDDDEMERRRVDRRGVIEALRAGKRASRIPEASWTPAGIGPAGIGPVGIDQKTAAAGGDG